MSPRPRIRTTRTLDHVNDAIPRTNPGTVMIAGMRVLLHLIN
jgi:hypothetical protein